jgi:hypothetical protein
VRNAPRDFAVESVVFMLAFRFNQPPKQYRVNPRLGLMNRKHGRVGDVAK